MELLLITAYLYGIVYILRKPLKRPLKAFLWPIFLGKALVKRLAELAWGA